jgi:hypothetical protein
MKSILKWASLIFAIIVVGFSIYALISAVGMKEESWHHPDFIPLVMVSFVVIPVGAIFLCVGAFKHNKTVIIVGAIIFIFGVACLIFTYKMGVTHMERSLSDKGCSCYGVLMA